MHRVEHSRPPGSTTGESSVLHVATAVAQLEGQQPGMQWAVIGPDDEVGRWAHARTILPRNETRKDVQQTRTRRSREPRGQCRVAMLLPTRALKLMLAIRRQEALAVLQIGRVVSEDTGFCVATAVCLTAEAV